MQDYHKLDVWHRAHAFQGRVHRTTRGWGHRGYGNLRKQLVKSAESIPFNIVEGCYPTTAKRIRALSLDQHQVERRSGVPARDRPRRPADANDDLGGNVGR